MFKSKKTAIQSGIAVLLGAVLSAGAASATTLNITITNTQGDDGLYLTPLLSIFHDGNYDAFEAGTRAGGSLELLAEEGSPADIIGEIEELNAELGTNIQTAVSANPDGFAGAPVLDPGEITTISVELDPASQRYYTFLSMVIPSNDTFIGNDNPLAYELFDADGNFSFTGSIDIYTTDAWDAGTEEDNGFGAAFAPPTSVGATDTRDDIQRLDNLDFLVGSPQAPGGTVGSASGLLASITFEVQQPITPVPLPAGMPLLLGALGVFGVTRRAQRRKA